MWSQMLDQVKSDLNEFVSTVATDTTDVIDKVKSEGAGRLPPQVLGSHAVTSISTMGGSSGRQEKPSKAKSKPTWSDGMEGDDEILSWSDETTQEPKQRHLNPSSKSMSDVEKELASLTKPTVQSPKKKTLSQKKVSITRPDEKASSQKEINELKLLVEKQDRELAKAARESASKMEDTRTLKAKLHMKTEEYHQLQGRWQECQRDVDKTRKINEGLKEDNGVLTSELETVKRHLADIQQTREQSEGVLREENMLIRKEMQKKQEENIIMKRKCEEMEQQVKDLQETVGHLEDKLQSISCTAHVGGQESPLETESNASQRDKHTPNEMISKSPTPSKTSSALEKSRALIAALAEKEAEGDWGDDWGD